MIKHILLGTFCLAQFSFAYAKEVPNPKTDHFITTSALQQVPKTVIIKTKKFKLIFRSNNRLSGKSNVGFPFLVRVKIRQFFLLYQNYIFC